MRERQVPGYHLQGWIPPSPSECKGSSCFGACCMCSAWVMSKHKHFFMPQAEGRGQSYKHRPIQSVLGSSRDARGLRPRFPDVASLGNVVKHGSPGSAPKWFLGVVARNAHGSKAPGGISVMCVRWLKWIDWTTVGTAWKVTRANDQALMLVEPSIKERAWGKSIPWKRLGRHAHTGGQGGNRDRCQRMSLSSPLLYQESLLHDHFPGIIFSKIKMLLFNRQLFYRFFFYCIPLSGKTAFYSKQSFVTALNDLLQFLKHSVFLRKVVREWIIRLLEVLANEQRHNT